MSLKFSKKPQIFVEMKNVYLWNAIDYLLSIIELQNIDIMYGNFCEEASCKSTK